MTDLSVVQGIKVKFRSYYKYAFDFENDDGYYVHAGGNSEDMYRAFIEADREYTVQEITNELGGVLHVRHNGEALYEES